MDSRLDELATRLQAKVLKRAPDALLLELDGRRLVVRAEDGRLVVRSLFHEERVEPGSGEEQIERLVEHVKQKLTGWEVRVAEAVYRILRERFGSDRVKIKPVPFLSRKHFHIVVQAGGRLGKLEYDRIEFEGSSYYRCLTGICINISIYLRGAENIPLIDLETHTIMFHTLTSILSNRRLQVNLPLEYEPARRGSDRIVLEGYLWPDEVDDASEAFRLFLTSLLGARNIFNALYEKMMRVVTTSSPSLALAVYSSLLSAYVYLKIIDEGMNQTLDTFRSRDVIEAFGRAVFGMDFAEKSRIEALKRVSLLDPLLERVASQVAEIVYPLIALHPSSDIRRPRVVVRLLSEIAILNLAVLKVMHAEKVSRSELSRALDIIARYYSRENGESLAQLADQILLFNSDGARRFLSKFKELKDPEMIRIIMRIARNNSALLTVPLDVLARAVWLGILEIGELRRAVLDAYSRPRAKPRVEVRYDSNALILRLNREVLNYLSALLLLSLPPSAGAWVEDDVITVLTRNGIAARVLPLRELQGGLLALVVPEGAKRGVLATIRSVRDIERAVLSALSGKTGRTVVVQIVRGSKIDVEREIRVELAEYAEETVEEPA